MFVIGFGTYDTTRHPRVGILLQGLTDLGVHVLELNSPLGFSTAERVQMMQQPWLTWRLFARVLRCWFGLGVRRLRLALPPSRYRTETRPKTPDAVLVGYLGHFDVLLARLLFPATVIALDMLLFARDTAIDRGESSRVKLWLFGWLDTLAVSVADVIVVDTYENALLVPVRQQAKVVVAAVGAGPQWFHQSPTSRPRGPAGLEELSVVFFGLFTPLQGTPTIARAIAELSELPIRLTMIGQGQDYARARELTNGSRSVTWVPWVDPRDLPPLIAKFDVCLGIFGDTPKAKRVVPNKVYEGAAAGCAIVTSDTPPQRRALGKAAIYVPPNDPQSLATVLRQLMTDTVEVEHLRGLAQTRARIAFRPADVATPLLGVLDARVTR